MSHEIEYRKGKYSMAYRGELPWHGLGTKIDGAVSAEEIMKIAGLDWTVEKHPLFTLVNGVEHQIEDRKALVRADDSAVLDIVGQDWMPTQNKEMFDFYEEYVRSGGLQMETAGSLKGGQQVWALAKIMDSVSLFGKDEIVPYLLFSNPHKFGQGRDVRLTAIRVVCNNTLTLSLSLPSMKKASSGNHRTRFNPAQVAQDLGIVRQKMETYKDAGEFLASKRFTDETVKDFMSQIFPSTSTKVKDEANTVLSRSAVKGLEILESMPTYEFSRGTWWDAFNAVTFLTSHEAARSQENRVSSQWFGVNKDRAVNAMELAVKMATAAV